MSKRIIGICIFFIVFFVISKNNVFAEIIAEQIEGSEVVKIIPLFEGNNNDYIGTLECIRVTSSSSYIRICNKDGVEIKSVSLATCNEVVPIYNDLGYIEKYRGFGISSAVYWTFYLDSELVPINIICKWPEDTDAMHFAHDMYSFDDGSYTTIGRTNRDIHVTHFNADDTMAYYEIIDSSDYRDNWVDSIWDLQTMMTAERDIIIITGARSGESYNLFAGKISKVGEFTILLADHDVYVWHEDVPRGIFSYDGNIIVIAHVHYGFDDYLCYLKFDNNFNKIDSCMYKGVVPRCASMNPEGIIYVGGAVQGDYFKSMLATLNANDGSLVDEIIIEDFQVNEEETYSSSISTITWIPTEIPIDAIAGGTFGGQKAMRVVCTVALPPDPNDVDDDGDGFTENEGDCNDDPLDGGAVCYPGAEEICDGYDNDCSDPDHSDGVNPDDIDEGCGGGGSVYTEYDLSEDNCVDRCDRTIIKEALKEKKRLEKEGLLSDEMLEYYLSKYDFSEDGSFNNDDVKCLAENYTNIGGKPCDHVSL
ncbi:putative metal-binding motif-containing protein [Candidatus Parcubacteria bacterium]|nr:putative metal-binding motif-containing protein [Candidatus Parcubacteria bacterium]